MDWKDLGQTVSKVAPMLGSLLGGPAGATIGTIIASAIGTETEPKAILEAMQTNPEAALKLAQIESDERVKLQGLAVDQAKAELSAMTQMADSVNQTMQVEAKSEHWATYGWRPAIGFSVAIAVVLSVLTVFGAYISAVAFGHAEGLAQLPGTLAAIAGIIGVVSPILGIASWFRGKMQSDPNIQAKNGG